LVLHVYGNLDRSWANMMIKTRKQGKT
jgi:hypothetical protein